MDLAYWKLVSFLYRVSRKFSLFDCTYDQNDNEILDGHLTLFDMGRGGGGGGS